MASGAPPGSLSHVYALLFLPRPCTPWQLREKWLALHLTAQPTALSHCTWPLPRASLGRWPATPLRMRKQRVWLERGQGTQPCGCLGHSCNTSRGTTCLQTTDFYILNISFSGLCAFGYFEAFYIPSFWATFFFFLQKGRYSRWHWFKFFSLGEACCGGRMGWFRKVVACSGLEPNIVGKCSEKTQNT